MTSGTKPPLDRQELISLFQVLSHDLKSPIFSIDGFSELLAADYSDGLDEEGRDFVMRIRSGVSQMRASLDGFNRVVNILSKPVAAVEQIDLDDLLAKVFDRLASRAGEYGVRLETDGDLPVVRGDREKLEALFQALVSNAIEYCNPNRDESWVRVGHTSTDGTVEIAVSDNGIGIDPEHHDQIFEAGLRLDRTRGVGGGFGLFLARKIAEAHGGTLRLDSSDGSGATFTVTLSRF